MNASKVDGGKRQAPVGQSAHRSPALTGPTWAEVDLDAIRSNLRAITSACAGTPRSIAVIKADAYGHGAEQVARAVLEAGAWGLGVARVQEGVELRRLGITEPILVLSYSTDEELPAALSSDLTISVSGWQTALMLSALGSATGRTAKLHLEVDTGMRRFGVEAGDAGRFVAALGGLPSVRLEGLYTHFATADVPTSLAFRSQLRLFRRIVAELEGTGRRPRMVHAANSAAALCPESRFDAVRVGIALYGVQPVKGRHLDLKPAMSVKASVGRVLDVHAGDGVSYGHTYVAPALHRAAVVTCGYADGYTRSLSDKGEVLIQGERCRVLGRVCMDSLIVGLRDGLRVSVGDEAVLLGSQGAATVTAEELAGLADTIPYEILCGLGRRGERVYTG